MGNQKSDSELSVSSINLPQSPSPTRTLATVLSRLAAIQGHAVPVHKFAYTQYTIDGISIDSLALQEQAIELWRACFPEAQFHVLSLDQLEVDLFPLVFISNGELILVRGRGANNDLLAEDETGVVRNLAARDMRETQFLQFQTHASIERPSSEQASRSASDWFSHAVRAHRGIFAEAILATFVISLIGLATAMYTMQVYDRVVPTKGYATLIVLSVGVVLAVLLELIIKQVRASMVDRACKAIDQSLSSVFFGKALDIRLDARPATVGTFAAQIRHFESVRNFMTSSTLFIFADAPFALLFIGVIAFVGGQVALVPLVILPIAILIGVLFKGPVQRYATENMTESNQKNGLLIESIDGIESIKAVGAEWKLIGRWRKLTATMAQSELSMRQISSLSTNLSQTLQQFSYLGMIAVGAYLITLGELTMGALIACSIIGGRALGPLAQVPSMFVQWQQAKIALDVLDQIMELPGERDSGQRLVVPESCKGYLQAEAVVFSYGKGSPSLQLPNFSVKPGDKIAILGSIGSGKTSLLKILGGFFKPQQGRISLDGVDITHLAPEFVREHIGYLPQDVRLFNGTLRENLSLGLPTPSDELLLRVCALTGLDQVIHAHEAGLELTITEGGRGLSGGQRQLVGITRMLLAKPLILLLDEPTASMDSTFESRVLKVLFEETPNDHAVIVVTHKIAVLPYVDRVIVVDKGVVLLDGPRDEVMQRLKVQPKPLET